MFLNVSFMFLNRFKGLRLSAEISRVVFGTHFGPGFERFWTSPVYPEVTYQAFPQASNQVYALNLPRDVQVLHRKTRQKPSRNLGEKLIQSYTILYNPGNLPGYLSDFLVPNYGQKPPGGVLFRLR